MRCRFSTVIILFGCSLFCCLLVDNTNAQEGGQLSWLPLSSSSSSSLSSSSLDANNINDPAVLLLNSDGNLIQNLLMDDDEMAQRWSALLMAGDRSDTSATEKETEDLGRELTFGELSVRGIGRLIHIADFDEDDVFLDLGSGTATAVLMVASLYPTVHAIGVEYAQSRHDVALERLEMLSDNNESSSSSMTSSSSALSDRVDLWQGNFLQETFVRNYKDVTVVFTNSIAFSDDTVQALRVMILERMPKLRLVVSSIRFHDDCYRQPFDVSWGSDTFALWVCAMNNIKRANDMVMDGH